MSGAPGTAHTSRAAVLAWTAAGLAWTVFVDLPAYADGRWSVLTLAVPGAAFVVAGGTAILRRPDHPAGRVLMLIGWLWPIARFQQHGWIVAGTASLTLHWLWVVPLIYLVLTFPERRPTARADTVILGLTAFDALVVQVAWVTFLGDARTCATCPPRNMLDLFDDDRVYAVLDLLSFVLAIALLVAVIVRVARRWTAATAPARRVLSPVIATGAVALAGLLVTFALMMLMPDERGTGRTAFRVTSLLVTTVPFGFVVGLLRARARRARVGELVVELGELPPPAGFEAALRKALGDPELVAAFWDGDEGRYVRPDGAPLRLPADDDASTATFLDRAGEPLAVIVHDRALLDDPGLLAATTAAARLAVENERLQREVLDRLAEVHASRARIVQAADEARRRIERDLHDGAQQRLVALRVRLRLLGSLLANDATPAAQAELDNVVAELSAALGDLRALASGIHPMILSQEGLAAAVESLAERSDQVVELGGLPEHRLPEAVEIAAYYVVCEALTNAAKHARASRVRVAVTDLGDEVRITVSDDGVGGADLARGSGLRGIADRIHALDGWLELRSSPGDGTTLIVRLPLRADARQEITTSTG